MSAYKKKQIPRINDFMRNTSTRFGFLTIFLHWLDALVIVALFATGFYMVELTYYDSLYKPLPFIHKSIGVLMMFWFPLRLVWRLANPVPDPVQGLTPAEHQLARTAHRALYLLIAVVLISGYLIPTASGAPVSVFDLFSIPATISGIANQEDTAGAVHRYAAYALIGLVVLHASAALKHHFINHDNTLRRMLGMSDKS